MALYRSKPVEVRAEQWFSGDCLGVFTIDPKKVHKPMSVCKRCDHLLMDHGMIETMMGYKTVCPGDWICTDKGGIKFVEHNHKFIANYEPVDE